MEKTEAYGLVAGGGFGIGEGINFVTLQGNNNVHKETNCDPDESSDPTEFTPDLVAATSFGAQRKKRLPRQRRSSVNVLAFPSSSSHVTPPIPTRVTDPRRLRFLFEKELKNSDVGSLRRMILPKKAAEAYLPVLLAKEGMFISMDDMDGQHVWNFKFRYWPNNNSRMYVLENTGEFVNTHGLRHGDYIVVYQDNQNQDYVIEARKLTAQDIYTNYEAHASYADYARNAVNDYFLNYSEVNKSSYFPENVPIMDDVSMPFIYDTTFSNDSPLDFWAEQ
ncbi:unnamed protein product [Ilex paraguariensis]|uniref:TF-B3 domain-containing protein n=1 Tax=Ilex paraguariensis TaxID=185542 RepID=A0ABC8U4D4_9AQUA